MKKNKKIALGCGGGCLTIILIPIILLSIYAVISSFGWRANVYTYDSLWHEDGSWRWNEGNWWRWVEGDVLLLHGEKSFELVYRRRTFNDSIGERIGRIRPLPVVTEENPDNHYLRRGFVYAIEGLNPNEWIYVIYEEVHNLGHWGYHHRIYKSTDLIIENPLEFLEEHFDSLQSIRQ